MQASRSSPRAARSSLLRLAASLAVAIVIAPPGNVAADEADLPSFSAEHVRRHEPSGIELARVRVELSPAGLRLREHAAGNDLEVIQDFVGERLWFVDRGRRMAHEVDLDALGSKDEHARRATAGGLLGTTPCGSDRAVSLGHGRWRGRRITAWTCIDDAATRASTALVDEALGIVVRRDGPDGIVDELRDIRVLSFGAEHFSPPVRFRRVDERELVLGAPAIATFEPDRVPDIVRRGASSIEMPTARRRDGGRRATTRAVRRPAIGRMSDR